MSYMKHHVDMSTPLLTADGFPRDDIDVAQGISPTLLFKSKLS